MSEIVGSLRRLATRSAIFVVADFLQLAIGFFLLPLYTSHLGPADYGALSVARAVGAILIVLYLQSLESAYVRFYYDLEDERRRREFFGSLWVVQLGYTAVITAGLEIAGRAGLFEHLISVPYDPHLRLVVWTTFLIATALLLPRALFLAREQAWYYAGSNIFLFLLSLAAIVYFVAWRGEGAAGSLRGTFIATACVAVPGVAYVLYNIRLTVNMQDVKRALALALPLVPHLLSLWVLSLADRVILERYVSLDDVGVYSLGYQIGSVPQLVAFAVATAIDPFYFRVAATRADARPILSTLATYYILIVTCAGIATVALAPEMITLMKARPEYRAALTVIPWVVLGSAVRGFYFVFLAALTYAKSVRMLPLVTVAAAILNIALNVILIPRFGYIAAAITTVAAYVVQAVMLYYFAQRSFPIPYQWRRLAILTLAAGLWGAILWSIALPNPLVSLGVKGLLLAFFPAALFLMRFFPAEERLRLAALWVRR